MCRRRRKAAEATQLTAAGIEAVHRTAGIAVWERAAGDDDLALGCSHRGVAERGRQAGDDTSATARAPGHDRVQPVLARVPADDVCLPGDHGGGVVAAGRSEERRVGKEGRSRWSPYHLK